MIEQYFNEIQNYIKNNYKNLDINYNDLKKYNIQAIINQCYSNNEYVEDAVERIIKLFKNKKVDINSEHENGLKGERSANKLENKILRFDEFLNENYDEELDDIYYEIADIKTDILYSTLNDFKEWLNHKDINKNQVWNVVPYNKIKTVWKQYMKFGFVKNEKLLEEIKIQFIINIIQLDVNTILSGHDVYYPTDEMDDCGVSHDDLQEYFGEFVYNHEQHQYNISDYALKLLFKLMIELKKCKKSEEIILVLDKILNIVHQRSYLASLFVEGGKANLDDLTNE
jgi:hypothetical protein